MRVLLIAFLCLSFTFVKSQDVIHLKNPSFEDIPRASRPPEFWQNYGFPDESPPDTHPSGEFSVSKPAFHGNTYLGLVVRDNDTYESVGQDLTHPLKKGSIYKFSLKLCKSDLYMSLSRKNKNTVNYNKPAIIKIFGHNKASKKKELLWNSPPISSTDWEEHLCEFKLTQNADQLSIVAYYHTPTLSAYNGNVLVDDCSPIVEIGTLSEKQIDSLLAIKPKISLPPIYKSTMTQEQKVMIYRNKQSEKKSSAYLLTNFDSIITLKNPSFEGRNRFNKMPTDWRNCSFSLKKEQQPNRKAMDGEEFIVLEAKANGEQEGLFQEISYLEKGKTYTFQISLAFDESYKSKAYVEGNTDAFAQAVTLQLWGASDSCQKEYLLFETAPITHSDWQSYTISFTPEEYINFIGFLPHWTAEATEKYNGHLLIDHCTEIRIKE